MDINSFLQSISRAGGLARPTRFQVNIFPTTLIQNAYDSTWLTQYAAIDGSSMGTRLTFMCARAALPGYQFVTEQQRTYGPAWKFPVMPEYQDLTLTFYVGQDMNEKYFFDAWMYSIMDPVSNNMNYISEYACQIEILQFDESSNEVDQSCTYLTTLIDAFPISVADLQLAWEDLDQVHKLDVTFAYKAAIPFVGKSSNANTGVRGSFTQFNDTYLAPGGDS